MNTVHTQCCTGPEVWKAKTDNLEDTVRRLKQEKSASEKELKAKDKEMKKVKT